HRGRGYLRRGSQTRTPLPVWQAPPEEPPTVELRGASSARGTRPSRGRPRSQTQGRRHAFDLRPPAGRDGCRFDSLGPSCFVPEPAQNIHLPLSKKKQAGFEVVGLSCQWRRRSRDTPSAPGGPWIRGVQRNDNAKTISKMNALFRLEHLIFTQQ